MNANYTTRQTLPTDWIKIEAAFSHSFRITRTPAVWRWRYNNPLDNDDFLSASICLTPSGQVVGFAGGTVHPAVLKGKSIKVVIARDSFSVPQVNQSLSRRTSPFLMADKEFHKNNCQKYSMALGFGSIRRSKLGEKVGFATGLSTGIWYGVNLSGLIQTTGSSCMIEHTDFTHSNWNSFWEFRSRHIQFGILRNQSFLNWRFNSKQGNTYWSFAVCSSNSSIPLGYVVLSPKSDGVAVIVDCAFANDFQMIRDALQKIQNWLYYKGIRRVETFSTPGCPEFPAWVALGFFPFEIELKTLPIFMTYDNDIESQKVKDIFAMTLADSDLF